MGGLHIALNFMHVIGKHMAGSGLGDLWVASDLMAEGSATKVLDGKAYNKGMRAHKLTLQAFWHLLHPLFLNFLDEQDFSEADSLSSREVNLDDLREYVSSPSLLKYLSSFLKNRSEADKNFKLWWMYIDMVLTLLMFTRGIRAGDWGSYRGFLSDMLPYIALYDHGNNLKSLSVYIADMNQLPPKVEAGFRSGDFAVLRTKQKFCQVDPDHAQEWVVGTCKDASGGILGITQDVRTLQRWALSLHWRSKISEQTYNLFKKPPSETCHKEETRGRRARDAHDENSILQVMETYNLATVNKSNVLHNVATKDVATAEISDALLTAKQRGIVLVQDFVCQRLVKSPESCKVTVSYHATIHKNNTLTFANLYTRKTSQDAHKKQVFQTDRDFFRLLISAFDGGRKIDLKKILKHELCQVPISLATLDGELRTAEKVSLVEEIVKGVECLKHLPENDKSDAILIIDGMAFVLSLGRPNQAETFGDYAACFIKRILYYGYKYKEVHVVFDRYRAQSVKVGTRKKTAKGYAPVRRDIEDCNVPLPKNWSNFLFL
ncbi:unnamed protein product [Phaedon cochleariae]|uniref:Uncharacterized protein n=1 Tax=Phaedon cochleariae TaxID=80249 RepID=A0A9N9X5W2_PHACE|nr:unnamed protein product [Phaedon cochleariae]